MPEGFEEHDLPDGVELVAYVDAAGERVVREAFPDGESEPVEPGWEDRWRAFHHGVRAGGLWIGPPWERPPADVPAVVVDPGRAFGTGAHPTTRLCVELLSRERRGSVLDAGCGSGVLAVAAARLGHGPVHAVDVDATAVEVAQATARINDVSIHVSSADAVHDRLPAVDLIVANIELRVVEALLSRALARRAVVSGYLVSDAPAVDGWDVVHRLELDGWAADVLEKPTLS